MVVGVQFAKTSVERIINPEKILMGRIGIIFLVLAIILNKTSNVSDLVLGILYGISIGMLSIGIYNN